MFLLVYLNFGRLTETLIVMLSIPFSLVGGIWLMYWLGYNLSIAAVVGFIGLIGIAAESGMVMLTFIDQSLTTLARQRKAMTEKVMLSDLYEAVIQGAVYRIRPDGRRHGVGDDPDTDHFPGGVCGGEGDSTAAEGLEMTVSSRLDKQSVIHRKLCVSTDVIVRFGTAHVEPYLILLDVLILSMSEISDFWTLLSAE